MGAATEGILWIDEINELHYQLSRIRRGLFSFDDLSVILKGKRVFAAAAADDPIPLLIGLARFFKERLLSPRTEDTMLNL
jgi:hypothetical protein